MYRFVAGLFGLASDLFYRRRMLGGALLDTAGDHLVLLRVTLDVAGVDFPVELLQLSRTDDVQSRQTALFDVGAEDAARALLAEWAATS